MTSQNRIVAYTHTALRERPKRMYTIGDISLPGLSIPGIGAGVGALVACVTVGMIVQRIIGGPIVLLSLLVGVVAAFAAYSAWGRISGDLGGLWQTFLFWADYTFRQPRVIHGKGADTEPTRLRWQVILWEPTDPGWLARRDATYRWLIDHAPDGTAVAATKGDPR